MADIEISVEISKVFKEIARRTSVATETDPFYANMTTEKKQYSQLHGEGDRITSDFLKESSKEVLKAYLSRQGDVAGLGYEYDSVANPGLIIYRVSEGDPVLGSNQTAAITKRLLDNTEDALVYYVLLSLYRTDGNIPKYQECSAKCLMLIDELSGDLYRLHD